jgi:hypothetical protein
MDDGPNPVTTYEVIMRNKREDLVLAVNAYINTGWKPIGGVCASVSHSVYTTRLNHDGDLVVTSDRETLWAQAVLLIDVENPRK